MRFIVKCTFIVIEVLFFFRFKLDVNWKIGFGVLLSFLEIY